jgi:hypothetical protein
VHFVPVAALLRTKVPVCRTLLRRCRWGEPSWRIVLEEETCRLGRFKQLLRPEERVVFDDLLNQCKLYATQAGCLVSPVKEVPLLLSMIFAQHKRLAELEKRVNDIPVMPRA